jgi:hypothetical protein
MAIGAVMAGLGDADVHEMAPGKISKGQRWQHLHLLAKEARVPLPEGPRGGLLEDELDAIWLGWWAATNLETVIQEARVMYG